MGGEPAPLNHIGEGVVHMLEVKIHPHRRRRADHTLPIQGYVLSIGEQLHVLPVMTRFESLRIVQSWKTNALKVFQLLRVFLPSLQNHHAVAELSVVSPQKPSRPFITRY
jgi:hypothetical protein